MEHSAGDDIESFLWVLCWVVVRNAPSTMTDLHRNWFLEKFDQRLDGGQEKYTMLLSGSPSMKDLHINTAPISDLLLRLWLKFGGRYGSDRIQSRSEDEARTWLQELDTHDWMIGELKEALAKEGWKDIRDASVPRQVLFPHKTLTVNQRKRKSAMSQYGYKPLNKRTRLDAVAKN